MEITFLIKLSAFMSQLLNDMLEETLSLKSVGLGVSILGWVGERSLKYRMNFPILRAQVIASMFCTSANHSKTAVKCILVAKPVHGCFQSMPSNKE